MISENEVGVSTSSPNYTPPLEIVLHICSNKREEVDFAHACCNFVANSDNIQIM